MGSSDNLQPQAIGLIFAFPSVATVAVALRLLSRTLTKSFAAGQFSILVFFFFLPISAMVLTNYR
jgi:hypothetical protein